MPKRKDDFIMFDEREVEQFIRDLDKLPDDILNYILQYYTDYGMLVEEGAKALVHHDEGTLEDSINFEEAKLEGKEVSVEGGTNLVYAMRRHEEPPRAGSHPKYSRGAKFPAYYQDGRGLKTRQKPNWRGKTPGRKFLENAIEATEEDYNKMVKEIADKALKGIGGE